MKRLALLLWLSVGLAWGQGGPGSNVVFARPFGGTITTVQASPVAPVVAGDGKGIQNKGQGGHVLVAFFSGAVADVTGLQLRIEVSFTCPNPPTCSTGDFFPISADITSADYDAACPLLGAVAVVAANGPFPYLRVNNLIATPGALAMDVRYSGFPFAVGSASYSNCQVIINPPGGGTGDTPRITWWHPSGVLDDTVGMEWQGSDTTTQLKLIAGSADTATAKLFRVTRNDGTTELVNFNNNGTLLITPQANTTLVFPQTRFSATTYDKISTDVISGSHAGIIIGDTSATTGAGTPVFLWATNAAGTSRVEYILGSNSATNGYLQYDDTSTGNNWNFKKSTTNCESANPGTDICYPILFTNLRNTVGTPTFSINDFAGIHQPGVTFAELTSFSFGGFGATGGVFFYCSDCTLTSGVDNTCAGSGTGAMAYRLNGAYKCFQ